MKHRWLRFLCALTLLVSLPLCACAEESGLLAAQVDLYIDGKFPSPMQVMTVDFDSSAFETLVCSGLSSQLAQIDVSQFDLTPENFITALQDVLNSHPELFYVGSTVRYIASDSDSVSFYIPEYLYSGDDLQSRIAAYNAALNRAVSYASSASTRVGQLLRANEYFCLNFTYDYTYSNHSADQLFSTGTGVCQAYMLAYEAVLDKLGIPSAVAVSDAMNHIWNLVQVNGSWYHIDVTWNDHPDMKQLGVGYGNFLLSDAGISAAGSDHHSWVAPVTADNTQYDDYFWRSMTMPLPMLGSSVYYVDPVQSDTTRTVMAHNLSTGDSSALFTYDTMVGGYYYTYGGGYDPFWATSSRIYYAVHNILYSTDHEGGDLRAEYVTSSENDRIWRLYHNGSALNMFIAGSPYDTGSVVPLTAQDISLTFSRDLLALSYGSYAQLTPLLNGMEAFALPLTWETSDENIAYVDENGWVVAYAPGLATVSVQSGDMACECLVLVHSNDVITLPQDTATIESEAFKGVSAQEIVLPEGVVSIGAGAFSGCENLMFVNLPASLEQIDASAFDGCDQVTLLCPPGQAGEAYATEYGIPFVTLP